MLEFQIKEKNERPKKIKRWLMALALTKQSWKWRRSRDAPMRDSLETAALTADSMMSSASGHVSS